MKFSYAWIKEFVRTDLDARAAADLLTAKSFEVKEIMPAGDDVLLDIDILPNRPDALSHVGIARELSALTGAKFTPQDVKSDFKAGSAKDFNVRIEDDKACPRYSALIVRGMSVGASPAWLKERLTALGLKSINNIVDITNYVMLETGQPLHAFDLNKLNGLVIRFARNCEKIKTLDEAQTEYELDNSVLVIADKEKPIAVAGIKGGTGTEITGSTRDILIESANFSPKYVRAASRKLNLRTDASIRFSYGTDPNMTVTALERAAQLIAEHAGNPAPSILIDIYPHKRKETKINLNPDYVRSLLGEDIDAGKMTAILKELGFLTAGSAKKIAVTVPTWRLDVSTPEDLIEEIGRVYGYENIKPKAPVTRLFDERKWIKNAAGALWDDYEFIRERDFIAHILAGIGYTESYNYSLLSDELKEKLNIPDMLELEQPLSHEYRWLCPSLLPRLLLNVRDNFRFFDSVRMFEVGHVFSAGSEPRRLAIILAQKHDDDQLFFELKSVVNLLHNRFGIWDIWYDDAEPFAAPAYMRAWCAPGRFAEVKTEDGQVLGWFGLLNKSVKERLKIKGTAAMAEFDLKLLIEHFQKEREFEPLPKYPSMVRDISLLVDPNTRISDILNIVQAADESGIIRDVDVFDIYEPASSEHPLSHTGEKMLRKSIAFHVVYRSDTHTLTDAEVTETENKIKKILQERLDAEIR